MGCVLVSGAAGSVIPAVNNCALMIQDRTRVIKLGGQLLPITMPVMSTSNPPSTTCTSADVNRVSMNFQRI